MRALRAHIAWARSVGIGQGREGRGEVSDVLGDGLYVAGNTTMRRGSCPVKKSSVRFRTWIRRLRIGPTGKALLCSDSVWESACSFSQLYRSNPDVVQ